MFFLKWKDISKERPKKDGRYLLLYEDNTYVGRSIVTGKFERGKFIWYVGRTIYAWAEIDQCVDYVGVIEG